MATKKVPARTKRAIQPQSATLLAKPYQQWEWVYVPSVGTQNLGATKIAGVFTNTAGFGGASKAGKAFSLGATQTDSLQLGNTTCKFTQTKPVSGVIVFTFPASSVNQALFVASSQNGGLYVKVAVNNCIEIDTLNEALLLTGPNNELVVGSVNTLSFCIEPRVVDGGTGRISYALNGKLVTGTWTAAPQFNSLSAFGIKDGGAEAFAHKQMLSVATAQSISNAALVALSLNPWQIFQQSFAKSSLWLNATAAPSGPAFQADAFQNDAFQTDSAGTISATLAITLDSVTVSSIATVGHPATLTATLDSVAFAATATKSGSTTAVLAITLDDLAFAASATVGHPATLAVTLDSISFAASAAKTGSLTATLAVTLDGISFDGAIVSGHNATIAFTLDDIGVLMSATNSSGPPTPGLLQTLIEIRSFTERRF